MGIPVVNPIEVGKGIFDTGFMVTTAAFYLIYSAIIIFFFVKWFVRLVNETFKEYRQTMDELLQLQKKDLRNTQAAGISRMCLKLSQSPAPDCHCVLNLIHDHPQSPDNP